MNDHIPDEHVFFGHTEITISHIISELYAPYGWLCQNIMGIYLLVIEVPQSLQYPKPNYVYDGYHYCWLDIQNDHNYYIQIYSFIIAKKPRIGTRKYHHNYGHYV